MNQQHIAMTKQHNKTEHQDHTHKKDKAHTEIIESKTQLIEKFEQAEKPPSDWRIGTEHEKIPFYKKGLGIVPYEGEKGIETILSMFQNQYGWRGIKEAGKLIALEKKGASIALEPGGQLELSGKPLKNLHQTCEEVNTHLQEVRNIGDRLGVGFLGLGFQPKWPLNAYQVMPKERYNIMKEYMPKVGGLGHQMMFRSATVQVNLDYGSEADMRLKFKTSLALQPFVTALFANSPFLEGRPCGFLSYRAYVWGNVDIDRTGLLPFVFEKNFGYEQYVDYALSVPMYFVYRDGKYITTTGESFKTFLKGELPQLKGEKPTFADWENHLSTLFPEVRMKSFLEMRGADSGSWKSLCALPAFWTGLLYDHDVLQAAWEHIQDINRYERETLLRTAPVLGLKTPYRKTNIGETLKILLELSESGLKKRAQYNLLQEDESKYLWPIKQIIETGKTSAEKLLEKYHQEWNQNIDPIFQEMAY